MNDNLAAARGIALALILSLVLWALFFGAIEAFAASVEGSGARGDIGTVYGNDLIACVRARQDAFIKANETCRGRSYQWQWNGCDHDLFGGGMHGTLTFSCR
jgi:hypothetical protein